MFVITAVKKSFDLMPEVFYFSGIIHNTRRLTNRPQLTDGTISRKFRELRNPKELINYECISKRKSQFKKIPINKQFKLEL